MFFGERNRANGLPLSTLKYIMIDTYQTGTDVDVAGMLARRRRTRMLVWAGMLTSLAIVFGCIAAISYLSPQTGALPLCLVGLVAIAAVWTPFVLWNNPPLGLYLIFVSALLFPGTGGTAVTTIPTTYVPVWWNISSIGQYLGHTGALNAIAVSPAELIIVLTGLFWLVRSVVNREFRLMRGPFGIAIAAYLATVAFGFAHGMATGGDRTIALYEVRAQAEFLLSYLLAVNIITDRKQIVTLLWIAVIAIGIQGVFGTITFIVQHGVVSDQGILSHDDSLVLNMLFFLAFLVVITRSSPRLAKYALWALPGAIISQIANNRRASIAAFAISLIAVIPILWTTFPLRRQAIKWFVASIVLFAMVYLPAAAWNSDGAWALAARAVRSQIAPSERDASSDAYRRDEIIDLLATRNSSPWMGYGYGKPFLQPVPLPVLTTELLKYMPHNSVLWIWMRLGHLGFFCFLMMYACVLIRGAQILKVTRDPLLKVMGMIAIAYMLSLFVYGKYDLQFVNARQMNLTAILIGILGILPRLDFVEEPTTAEPRQAMPAHTMF